MRKRREVELFGLSFLDAICCGFGAIVLLLVITKAAEPTIVRDRGTGLESIATALSDRLPKLDEKRKSLEQELASRGERLAELEARIARLAPLAAAKKSEAAEAALETKTTETVEAKLAAAKQSLTEEMERLYASGRGRVDDAIGGVPIDSEYVVFVIDTSGSMHQYAWPLVVKKLGETLDVYPNVKGMQVLSDIGEYMFGQYAGQWIPDTPGRRKVIVERLATWAPFSKSSPEGGIERAIRALASRERSMSIYVFGDEFTGPSTQEVLDTVRRMNPRDRAGKPLVRIHAIGFPTQFTAQGTIQTTGVRFANLMRRLCFENGGTFVGLPSAQR